ncbi:MAG: tyrosine-type recombinase/integrase [bacterium]
MSTHFNFIKKSLTTLRIPTKKIAAYHDTTKHGLKLLVRPTGIKTFVLYRKIQGRPERITIGRFPEVTIEQARNQVDTLNAKIASGINPNEEKRSLRSEMTIKNLFERYLERYAKVHKKSWQEDHNQFQRYLRGWENRKLSSIRKSHIQKLHAEVGTNKGHYAANRLLALLHTMFNRAIDWGWDSANPAHGIKKFKEKSRDRFIQSDELPKFFKALSEETSIIVRDYILLSLLTGARRSNVLAMRWDEINFDRATWTIPLTKNGESHTIPLVSTAIDVLKTRQENNIDSSPWVFPGAGISGHLVETKKPWKRILDKAGLKNLRIHDLRRSLGSWQAATGANLSIIGKTLAHKNVSTTAIYARLNIDPIRESMNKATDAMLNAAGVGDIKTKS